MRKGIYYQMFSGGNWKNQTYGASYAVSETLQARGEWKQIAMAKKYCRSSEQFRMR